eukprot:gene17521-12533_t
MSGGAEFFVLTTKRVVSRAHWTPIPMPDDAIDFLNGLAAQHAGLGDTIVEDDPDAKEPEVANDVQDAQDTQLPVPIREHTESDLAGENVDADNNHGILSINPEDYFGPAPDPEPPPHDTAITEDSQAHDAAPPLGETDPVDKVETVQDESPVNVENMNRRSTRNRTRNPAVYNDMFVYNISVSEGLRKHGVVAEDSIKAELSQMLEKK